jgi:hypothetical protein
MPRKPAERKPVAGGPVTIKAKIETHENKALPEPIKFEYTFVQLGDNEPIPDDENLSDLDIHDVVNAARKANAMSAARQNALENAGLIASRYENPDKAFEDLVKILVKQVGLSKEDAEAQARQTLGK